MGVGLRRHLLQFNWGISKLKTNFMIISTQKRKSSVALLLDRKSDFTDDYYEL